MDDVNCSFKAINFPSNYIFPSTIWSTFINTSTFITSIIQENQYSLDVSMLDKGSEFLQLWTEIKNLQSIKHFESKLWCDDTKQLLVRTDESLDLYAWNNKTLEPIGRKILQEFPSLLGFQTGHSGFDILDFLGNLYIITVVDNSLVKIGVDTETWKVIWKNNIYDTKFICASKKFISHLDYHQTITIYSIHSGCKVKTIYGTTYTGRIFYDEPYKNVFSYNGLNEFRAHTCNIHDTVMEFNHLTLSTQYYSPADFPHAVQKSENMWRKRLNDLRKTCIMNASTEVEVHDDKKFKTIKLEWNNVVLDFSFDCHYLYTWLERDGLQYYEIHEWVSGSKVYCCVVESLAVMTKSYSLPNLLLCSNGMKVIVDCDLKTEAVIEKLILHGGVNFAQSICEWNQWGAADLPEGILENCLEMKQLETVRFYFDSKMNFFRTVWDNFLNNANLSDIDLCWSQLHHMIGFSISHIEKLLPCNSQDFVEKLIKLCHNSLMELFKLFNVDESSLSEVSKCGRIMKFSCEVTHHMERLIEISKIFKKKEPHSTENIAFHDIYDILELAPKIKEVWRYWQTLEVDEVVKHAILNCNVPLVQSFLEQYHNQETSPDVMEVGKKWAQECLAERKFSMAKKIFINLGLNDSEELQRIYLQTTDVELRNTLFQHLRTDLDDHIVKSFHALNIIEQSPEKFEKQIGRHLNLAMLIQLSWSELQNILLETQLSGASDIGSIWSQLTKVADSVTIWQYLIQTGKFTLLFKWIQDCFLSSHLNSISFEITQDMVDMVQNEEVETKLASYGVFASGKRYNIYNIVELLKKVKKSDLLSPLNNPTANVSLSDFHALFISECLKQDSGRDLYHYLKTFKLSRKELEKQGVITSELLKCSQLMNYVLCGLELLTNQSSGHHNQKSDGDFDLLMKLFSLSVELSSQESEIDWKQCPEVICGEGLIKLSHSNLFGAELIQNECLESFIEVVKGFPPLYDAIVETYHLENYCPANLYTMVKEGTRLDLNKLFQWQKDNIYKDSDSLSEMPYFSNPNWVAKFGKTVEFDSQYLLQAGHPFLAYIMFAHTETNSDGYVPKERRNKELKDTYEYFMRRVQNYQAFVNSTLYCELLECDSHIFRASYSLFADVAFKELAYENLASLMCKLEERFLMGLGENGELTSSILQGLGNLGLFCRYHDLEMPVRIISYFAQRDDWIKFFIICQIVGYPKKAVLKVANKFQNGALKEHVMNILAGHPKAQNKRRRLKLKKFEESSDSEELVAKPEHESEDQNLLNEDLFQILLFCHRSEHPFENLISASIKTNNPNLCLFASSYQNASSASCIMGWIRSTLGSHGILMNKPEAHPLDSPMALEMRLRLLQDVAIMAVKHGYLRTLKEAFSVFKPNSFIVTIADFLLSVKATDTCLESKKLTAAWCNRQMEDDGLFEWSLKWEEQLAFNIVKNFLIYIVPCSYWRLLLLSVLNDQNLGSLFSDQISKLRKLECVERILVDADFSFEINALFEDPAACEIEYKKVIQNLMQANKFDLALEFAVAVGSPLDQIYFVKSSHEYKEKIQHGHMKTISDYISFWDNVNKDLQDKQINSAVISGYFQDCASHCTNLWERYYLLLISFDQMSLEQKNKAELNLIEQEMWIARIRAKCHDKVPDVIHQYEVSRVQNQRVLDVIDLLYPDEPKLGEVVESPDMEESVKSLQNEFLDQCNLCAAIRMHNLFKFTSPDLLIILATLEVLVPPASCGDVDEYHRRVADKYDIHLEASSENCDFVRTIIDIGKNCRFGLSLVDKIHACHRLSVTLGSSFQDVATNPNPLSLLKKILDSDFPSKLTMAHDLILFCGFEDEELATFLSMYIHDIVDNYIKEKTDCQETKMFLSSLTRLSHNTPVLAEKLLSVLADKQRNHTGKCHLQGLAVYIEHCILAHDCYTHSCHMEGIGEVLHRARRITLRLTDLSEWGMMVRLFVGIGRFVEMSYIFDILKEHHQFEYLLRKGMENYPGFKTALMNYLKRSHPDDRETQRLVAVHYQMHKEIGQMWKEDAEALIANLLARTPVMLSNDSSKRTLHIGMQNFAHAAEFFLQAGLLTHADKCAKQSQLLALQYHFANSFPSKSVPTILLLEKPQIDELATNSKISCSLFLLIADAYQHNPKWDLILFDRYIVEKDDKYLNEFLTRKNFTCQLLKNIVNRWKSSEAILYNPQSEQLERLFSCVSNLEDRYRTSVELDLPHISQSIIQSPEASFLKDVFR